MCIFQQINHHIPEENGSEGILPSSDSELETTVIEFESPQFSPVSECCEMNQRQKQWRLLLNMMRDSKNPNESFINYIATSLLYMDIDDVIVQSKLNIYKKLAESTSEWIMMEKGFNEEQYISISLPACAIKRSQSVNENNASAEVRKLHIRLLLLVAG